MAVKFTNNAKTTLASGINSSVTTATVTDGSVFPTLGSGEHFYCTFDDGTNNEIVKVTARSGNTLTIVRGVDNTTARAFSASDAAELRATSALLTDIQENIAAKSANQTVYSATTASSATSYDIGIDPGVEANASVFLNGVYQHHNTFSFSGSTLTFDTAPPNGMALEVLVDNLVNLQSSNLTVDTFTAADVGGNPQTDFTLSDAPAAEDNLLVFIDGVFQDQDAYTISNQTLTITDGVTADFGVTVYVINPVNIGTPSDGTVTSAKLSGNITMPADLIVTGDVAFDSPTFVIDNANSRVGIGTASPSTLLDIVGDVKMSANLTVDTSTLVVDATNNRVGIGTDSPSTQLHLNAVQAGSVIRLARQDGAVVANDSLGKIEFYTNDLTNTGVAGYIDVQAEGGAAGGSMIFGTGTAGSASEQVRIAASGNVGIGTDNPSSRLDIVHNNNNPLRLQNSTGVIVKTQFEDNASRQAEIALNTGAITFSNGTSSVTERMRIDSSGKLLVGKTSSAFGTAGVEASASNGLWATRSSLPPLALNRLSSDGSIVDFYKDGTTVGSIGTTGGELFLGSTANTDAFIRMGYSGIVPATSTGANRDAAIDFGTSSNRFKDLYLSGNVQMGGNLDVVGQVSSYDNVGASYTTMNFRATDYIYKNGGGSEKMRIDSSGNVGIGETSPLGKLHIKGSDTGATASAQGNSLILEDTENGLSILSSTAGAGYINFGDSDDNDVGMIIYGHSSNSMNFWTNAAERMRIDSSGNVGIGSGSPTSYNSAAQNLVIKDTGNVGITIAAEGGGDSTLMFADGTGGTAGYRGRVAYNHGSDRMEFHTSAAERMRVNSSGSLLVGGASSAASAEKLAVLGGSSTGALFSVEATHTTAFGPVKWRNGNGEIGSISFFANSVSYNTSSDYRLKENVDYDFNALERVAQLKPARFNFIADADTTVDGFLAHEVQDIVPEAISGEKDAVDSEGNPEYQGIDQSKLVPLLTKAIQEQQEQIETLKQEIREIRESG